MNLYKLLDVLILLHAPPPTMSAHGIADWLREAVELGLITSIERVALAKLLKTT